MIEVLQEKNTYKFVEKMRNNSLYLTELGLYYRKNKNEFYRVCSLRRYETIYRLNNLTPYMNALLMVALSNNEKLTGYKHNMKTTSEMISFLHGINPLIFKKDENDELHYRYQELYTLYDFQNYKPYWTREKKDHKEKSAKYQGRVTNGLYFIIKELKVMFDSWTGLNLENFKTRLIYNDRSAKTNYNNTIHSYKKTIFRMYHDDDNIIKFYDIDIDFKNMIVIYKKQTEYSNGKYKIDLNKNFKIEESKDNGYYNEVFSVIKTYFGEVIAYFVENKGNLNTITELFMLADKINNYEHKKIILENRFKIKGKSILLKTKFNKYFDLNKNTYKMLLEMQEKEVGNFLRIKNMLQEDYKELYNDKNINFLIQDDFTMVDEHVVSRALNIMSKRDVRYFVNNMSEFKKMFKYITVDIPERQRITGWAIESYYCDYAESFKFLIDNGYNTEDSFIINPFSIKLSHDIYTDEKLTIERHAKDSVMMEKFKDDIKPLLTKTFKLKENSEDEDDEIILIKGDTADKLKDEGKQLSHCVGTYTTHIINNKCLIFFARRKNNPDKSLYTIELRKTEMGYSLGQTQGHRVYKLPQYFNDELVKVIKKINKNNIKQEELKLSA